jgi:hypothetical protein
LAFGTKLVGFSNHPIIPRKNLSNTGGIFVIGIFFEANTISNRYRVTGIEALKAHFAPGTGFPNMPIIGANHIPASG